MSTNAIKSEGIVNLCPYRHLFGISGKGIHSYRFYDVAVLDVGVTLLSAIFIAYVFSFSYFWTILVVFILGIFVHRMFYVRTTVDKIFFSKPRDEKCPTNDSKTSKK